MFRQYLVHPDCRNLKSLCMRHNIAHTAGIDMPEYYNRRMYTTHMKLFVCWQGHWSGLYCLIHTHRKINCFAMTFT